MYVLTSKDIHLFRYQGAPLAEVPEGQEAGDPEGGNDDDEGAGEERQAQQVGARPHRAEALYRRYPSHRAFRGFSTLVSGKREEGIPGLSCPMLCSYARLGQAGLGWARLCCIPFLFARSFSHVCAR